MYDICMFEDGECSGQEIDRITGGWEVCYLYTGWRGYTIVLEGDPCK